jgi:glycosyltransferase involved in cell wall biosynthesis
MNVMDTRAFANAERTIVSARAYEKILGQFGVPGRRMSYFPLGLHLAPLEAAAAQGRDESRPVTIGFVGRVEPRKGQLDLVRAFARVRSTRPGLRLHLVGPVADPKYQARIERAIVRERLQDAVACLGYLPNVARELASWSLFVSLSRDEGQGLAVLEAMALGVPVLALAVPGIEDYLVDGKNGFLLDRTDAPAVAHLMGQVLASGRTRSRVVASAMRMVRRRYDWNLTVEAVFAAYREAIADRGLIGRP